MKGAEGSTTRVVAANTGNVGLQRGTSCNGQLRHYQIKPADNMTIQEE